MAIPFLQVKPKSIKLKVSPKYPANLFGRVGINVVKQTGDYFIDLYYNYFPPVGGIPPADGPNLHALLWNKVTQAYTLTPISLFGGSAGIPDAPSNGTLYGRLNATWAPAAPLASPVFTGDPQAPTPAPGDSDASIATTAFVAVAVANAPPGPPGPAGPPGPPGGIGEAPTDHKVYGRQDAAWTPVVSGGGSSILVSDTPPAGAADNNLWWESDTGILYIRYNDGNSSQFVAISGGGGGASVASSVTFTPTGNVASTDVQAAIAEVDSEKVAKAGDTMTGLLKVPSLNVGNSPRAYPMVVHPAANENLAIYDNGSGIVGVGAIIDAGGAFAPLTITGNPLAFSVPSSFDTTPIAPTPAAGDNSTKVATTAFVTGKGLRSNTILSGGSGTYTTKAGCTAIKVRMSGGGGGGGSLGGLGGTGGSSIFGSLTAGGGGGGAYNGSAPPTPGTSGGGDIYTNGGYGYAGPGTGGSVAFIQSPPGLNGPFGGGTGEGGWGGNALAAQTNSGSGGGGTGGNGVSGVGGSAGGGGGYCEKLIIPPAASYSYAVGAGGAGNTSNGSGGSGGSGIIIVEEYF